ncbi:hypothetical protein HOP50_20g86850 [Chloropicon primus]|nr:hypothetical protein HOP50_20g86850 [Chloropicon primus]
MERARYLESEHKRSTMRVREAETRKKLFLMKLKHEAKVEDLGELERERSLSRKAMASVLEEKKRAREEKEKAERRLREMREEVRQERQQKENLYTIIQSQQQEQRRSRKQRKAPEPSPSLPASPEEDRETRPSRGNESVGTPKNHKVQLRQRVVPLKEVEERSRGRSRQRVEEASTSSGASAERASGGKKGVVDLTVPYQPPQAKSEAAKSVRAVLERKRKEEKEKQPLGVVKLEDVDKKLSECERNDKLAKRKTKDSANKAGAFADKSNTAPNTKKIEQAASAAAGEGTKADATKRKFQMQSNGWSGTSCLSALPPNLLFGENFRVPKLLKK